MQFVFLIPGLGRNEVESSTSTEKTKSLRLILLHLTLKKRQRGRELTTCAKASGENTHLRARTHPYSTAGFSGCFK